MNQEKINKIEKIKDQVMYLDEPGEFISDVCGKLNEIIYALQDEAEDTKHELYPVCRDDVKVVSKAYKDGYQQAMTDALDTIELEFGSSFILENQKNFDRVFAALEKRKKLQEK